MASAPEASLAPAQASRSALGRERALMTVLFFAGLAVSGFTILRGGAEFDEGLVLQAARRLASGQVLYTDFQWAYGPGHPYLLGGTFKAFGPSLLGWRVLRVAVDAATALAVYSLARRQDAPRWAAGVAWLVAVCAASQPTSASPFAPALLLALGALLAATRSAGLRRRDIVAAAVLTAATAAWRIDVAAYAGAGVLTAVALMPGEKKTKLVRLAGYFTGAFGLALVVYLPFAVSAGVGDLYNELVGVTLRERDYWTLPFPLSYDGPLTFWPPAATAEDLKDVLGFYTPAIALTGLGLALAWAAGPLRQRRLGAMTGGLIVLALGCLVYLMSRPDEFHASPLIIVLAAILAPGVASTRTPSGQRLRGFGIAAGALLAVLAAYGVANRASALLMPPELTRIDLPVADGAQAPPAEAVALTKTVRLVQRRVPRNRPIYTVTRRPDLVRFNQPLLYVLTDRDNPTRRDFGIQVSKAAQLRLTRQLARARPGAIVRWTDPITTVREPNLRGRPTGVHIVDRWIARHYRRAAAYGRYQVLVPRERPSAAGE